ncbi:MAG: hypothetical protein IJ662_03835 [Clostridia bacterium]|nr:hypothetical protein [Clostridia bacterium]
MKRWFSVLLIGITLFLMVGGASAQAASTKKFDHTVLKNLNGYEYDKFDKTWTYYQVYDQKYSDANVYIGIQMEGDKDGISYAPMLYVKIVDPFTGKPLHTVKALDILIDDTVYSYKKMLEGDTSSSVLLGRDGRNLVKAIANSKSNIDVKITLDYYSLTLEMTHKKLTENLIAISKKLIHFKVWDYLNYDTVDFFEALYPLITD